MCQRAGGGRERIAGRRRCAARAGLPGRHVSRPAPLTCLAAGILCAALLHAPDARGGTRDGPPAAASGQSIAASGQSARTGAASGRPAPAGGSGQPVGGSRQPGSAAAAPGQGGAALAPLPLDRDKVLAHIRQTIDWYAETQGVGQLPQLSSDVVARDRLRDAALATVKLAFQFGRAAAALLATSPAAAAPQSASSGSANAAATSSRRSLDDVAARISSRIAELQTQINGLDTRIARAPSRSRAGLKAQRDQANAALALEREVLSTVQNLRRFQSSMLPSQSSSSKDLAGQIADLEKAVPEVREGAAGAERGGAANASAGTGSGGSGASGSPAGSTAPAAASRGAASSGAGASGGGAASFHPESAGIITLVGQWIALQSADSQIGDMLKTTGALSKELDALRAPLVDQARTLVRMDMSGLASADRAQLEASRRSLEAATARFKQLAALLVPLADQDFALDGAHGALTQWRGSLRARLATAARYLLMRLVILATLVVAVLIVSEISRRAVFKYLHDSRLRSQFQTLRRVVVGAALVVVILFTLVSQLGSLATYVGFLTAGLAVALQNVILSIVAYFFLIGRYGVRVGDRITLAGVTGRVADIGLIRIYLMELAGADLHSTGRIVVLSNSVLFQPQAMFKQIPGADYLWHTISLTLAPAVDVQAAQQQLKSTADEVYEHYRPAIEAQHAAVRRVVDFDTAVPCPEVRVRFAEHGWQFDVRYPVQADQAARIDQRMLKAVRDALAREPQLPVADSGEPALKAVEA